MSFEYRVRWRREADDGYDDNRPARYKIYQKRRDAERWMAILKGEILEFDGIDPNAYACCSGGYECDCGGITEADRIAERMKDVPPLIEGPTLQARAVGPWEVIESGATVAGGVR